MATENKKTFIDQKTPSITFQVETLSPPAGLLAEVALSEIIQRCIPEVTAHSAHDYPLVSNGFHSFLHGMYQAYAEHRPFSLSPDMIWLLVCQGFSQHVNFGHNTADEVFPHLNTRQKLEINIPNMTDEDLTAFWGRSVDLMSAALDQALSNELVELLRADFSTTGTKERIASEITILDTFKPYFEYIVNLVVCGIPTITLEGETKDWRGILERLSKLRKYNLDWWMDQLEPILNEFVAASEGKVNTDFWRNMFKVHTTDDYGHTDSIDGWITCFFPYDRKGRLNNFTEKKMLSVETICEELPKEIVCVDFECRLLDNDGAVLKSIPMEYWAGFIGLRQDRDTYCLRPEIGWWVCPKNPLISDESPHDGESDSRVYYNLTAFPKELFGGKWWCLILNFRGQINLPWKVLLLSVSRLELNGKLNLSDQRKLAALKLKGVTVLINGK